MALIVEVFPIGIIGGVAVNLIWSGINANITFIVTEATGNPPPLAVIIAVPVMFCPLNSLVKTSTSVSDETNSNSNMEVPSIFPLVSVVKFKVMIVVPVDGLVINPFISNRLTDIVE